MNSATETSRPTLSSLFRSSHRRKELIASSLDPSSDLVDKLVVWSNSTDKTRLLAMRFHHSGEWRHPDCPVMKWYQIQTSTKFTCIQHWNNNKPPFLHEYLLIKLTDGSVCRVERIGHGSRATALSWLGCNAYDLAQWFPAGTEDELLHRGLEPLPKLIIEVHFPQPFDLLDVLSICYSIRCHHRAQKYTLQRYNCYFLCCTILAILTRRVGEQESCISQPQWEETVEQTLKCLPVPVTVPRENNDDSDVLNFLSFGIFSRLFPDSQEPAGFFLESLRSELNSTTLGRLNNAISGTVWQQDMHLAFENGLLSSVNKAMSAILQGSNPSSIEFRRFLQQFGQPPIPVTDPNFLPAQKNLTKAILKAYTETLRGALQRGEEGFTMRRLESKPSLPKRLASAVFRTTVVFPSTLLRSSFHFFADVDLHDIIGQVYRRYNGA